MINLNPKPHIDQMRKIMRDAINSTWKTVVNGDISSIEQLKLAYARAIQQNSSSQRNVVPMDMHTFQL